MPAKAGIQSRKASIGYCPWAPAFAGATVRVGKKPNERFSWVNAKKRPVMGVLSLLLLTPCRKTGYKARIPENVDTSFFLSERVPSCPVLSKVDRTYQDNEERARLTRRIALRQGSHL